MLKLDNVRMIADHQIHGDDDPGRPGVFYVMPRFPRIARLENGGLSLRFVEYDAIRVDGASQFGGFLAVDTDLSMLPETEERIRAGLQAELDNRFGAGNTPPLEVQTIPWINGAVRLLLEKDGKLVEEKRGSTVPSLTGNNTACFLVELTVLGTAILKDALSSGGASMVQVIYDLDHYVRLPKATADGTWHASAFYSFIQDVDIEDNFWSEDSYTEVVNTTRYNNEVIETHFRPVVDPNLSAEDQKNFDAWVHELIKKQLEDGVARNMLQAIQAVDPNVSSLTDDQDFENVHKQITNNQVSDVHVDWTEAKAIVRTIHPGGQLPSVVSLKDADGNPLKWEDYYSKVSVDEFLRSLLVSVRVDANYDDYGISLVEVKVRYPHGENAKTVEATFGKEEVGKAQKAEFIVADKIRKFFWSYTVHFTGDHDPWTSDEVEDDGTDLNVQLSHLPVLKLDVVDGDINFEQVAKARVKVRYEDGDDVVERFFNLTGTPEEKEQRLLEVLAKPRTGDVSYQTTYTMKGDGREITGPVQTTDADTISIEDPFRSLRTVTFQAVGDLTNDIAEVTVQATYEEPGNGYLQNFAVTLSAEGKTSDEWTFPTIDESVGKLGYRASILRKNGTTLDVDVPEAKGTRFEVGEKFADKLEVRIVPNLLDWTKLKLVNVSLRYDGSMPPKTDDFLFQDGQTEAKTWTVPLTDPTRSTYTVTTTYFLLDGTRKTVGPEESSSESVFPELPA